MLEQGIEQPDSTDSQPRNLRWARQRAELLQGMYIHVLVYAVINAGLFVVNWITRSGDGTWWVVWPLGIWGVGLAVHVLVTVGPVFSPDWLDRKTEELARRH